ncbi:MAG TPA: hypothetical protein VF118_08180 [Gemmatimonadaceae bacterium]
MFAPPARDAAEGFELLVPRDTNAPDFDRALDNCIDAIASFYDTPFNSVEALLLPSSEIVSVRLQGEGFTGGAAPFPQFERMLEHLKRTISRAASLVLTDDPLSDKMPLAARSFVNECWFLQTARGSFVTRVAMPTAGSFGGIQYSLFKHPRTKDAVASTLRGVSTLVGERVLAGDEGLFSEAGFESVRATVSVGVLEEFGRLLRGSGAEHIELSFNRAGDENTIDLPNLSDSRLARLDEFVVFVRERLHTVTDLDAVGTVFEVRRTRRKSGKSFVGMSATVDGRPEYVTFYVDSATLPVMLEHIRTRAPLRVRGRARRLRTQIRIEHDFQYIE